MSGEATTKEAPVMENNTGKSEDEIFNYDIADNEAYYCWMDTVKSSLPADKELMEKTKILFGRWHALPEDEKEKFRLEANEEILDKIDELSEIQEAPREMISLHLLDLAKEDAKMDFEDLKEKCLESWKTLPIEKKTEYREACRKEKLEFEEKEREAMNALEKKCEESDDDDDEDDEDVEMKPEAVKLDDSNYNEEEDKDYDPDVSMEDDSADDTPAAAE